MKHSNSSWRHVAGVEQQQGVAWLVNTHEEGKEGLKCIYNTSAIYDQ